MKITLNDEINQFLNRCLANITDDSKNNFVGMHITKKNEKKVIKMLADAGIPEFQDMKKFALLFSYLLMSGRIIHITKIFI